MKKISGRDEFYEKAEEAVKILAGIVKVTLGPDGLPIIFQRKDKPPYITKDGVTVAEEVAHEDVEIDTVIQAVKESARKTGEEVGDGTSTSIVLTEAIFNESMKYIKSGMITPQKLFRETLTASNQVYAKLNEWSQPIKSEEDRKNVAMISCNGDESIANCIVEAIQNVGQDGYIGLEQGTSRETTLRYVDGIHIDKGWQHWGSAGKDFVNIGETNEVVYENVFVALFNGTISKYSDLVPLMEMVFKARENAIKEKKPEPSLFIIAHNIVGEALYFLVSNKLQGMYPVYAIKTPISGSPNSASLLLDDLAVLTGGKTLSPEGIALPQVDFDCLGMIKKVVGKERVTVLYEPQGDPKEIEARVEAIKKQIEEATSEFDRDNLKKRVGQLVNGICLIGVGGTTDLEAKEKKDRVDDALCAVRAAFDGGIVAGGGMTLHYLSEELWDSNDKALNFGEKVLQEALKYPSKQIILNGNKNPDKILTSMPEKCYPMGYDARNSEHTNLLTAGIIDPTKVVRKALESAVSIASEMFRGGGIITFLKRGNDDNNTGGSILN